MGYNTCYSITILNSDLTSTSRSHVDAIIEEIVEISGYQLETFEYHEPVKWYDHESDLCKISNKYKSIVIMVEGFGDETGDIWIKYFHNGKLQVCNAITTFEPYDQNKLHKMDKS